MFMKGHQSAALVTQPPGRSIDLHVCGLPRLVGSGTDPAVGLPAPHIHMILPATFARQFPLWSTSDWVLRAVHQRAAR